MKHSTFPSVADFIVTSLVEDTFQYGFEVKMEDGIVGAWGNLFCLMCSK